MSLSGVQSLIDACSGGNESRVVATVDSVVNQLMELGLAYKVRLPPSWVGVHPTNRGGYGVSQTEVHALGAEILRMGWSWEACRHAICIEDDKKGTVKAFSAAMTGKMDGLAPTTSECKFGSLACSHTNQFLCCVGAEVPCEIDVLSVNGRMSKSRIFDIDPEMKTAVLDGMVWIVLKAEVAETFPTLCDLVQVAKNGPGSAQRSESEFQTLLRIAAAVKMVSTNGPCGVSVDWAAVKANILRTKASGEPGDVPDLIQYVQRWGGETYLQDLNNFHQVFVPSSRLVPGATFKSLSELKLAPDELMPFVVTAVLKTQASCPNAKVQNKVCRYVSSADISTIEKQKGAWLEAESVMKSFRSLAKGLSTSQATRFYGKLDTTIVRFLLKKPMPDNFKSLTDVASSFVMELRVLQPGADIKDQWGKSSPASSSAGPDVTKVVSNVVSYDADGNAIGVHRSTLQNKGFVVGTIVETSNGTQSTISCIDADGTVHLDKGSRVKFVKFLTEYNIAKTVVENIEEWEAQVPELNASWVDATIKAKIQCALDYEGVAVGTPQLTIQVKPVKSVFTKQSFPVGKLVLLPQSQRFVSLSKGTSAPPGALKVEFSGVEFDKDFYILPTFSKSFIVPAWAIKTVDNEDDANMAIVQRAVNVAIKISKAKALSISIPSIVNTKALKPGDELTLFKPAVAKAKRPPVVLDVGQTTKKAKQ